jgi:outer membrane protein assembly factor BamB
LVYIVVGDSGPALCAVNANGTGDITDSQVEWQMDRGGPKRPSLILQSDHLFMVTDDGVALCSTADSGTIVWKERLGGNFRASPILAGDRLYFFDLDGVCSVVAANAEKFTLIAKNVLDNGCQASPAVVGDSMYVRTTEHLYCIESAR